LLNVLKSHRIVKKRNGFKGVCKIKKLITGIIILFALWLILPIFNINSSYMIPNLIEWATKFVLPWIILYWLIRLVKGIEKNNLFK